MNSLLQNPINHQSPEPGNRTRLLALTIPALAGLFLLISSSMYLSSTAAHLDSKRMAQLLTLLLMIFAAILEPGIRTAFTQQLSRISPWFAYGLLSFFSLGVFSSLIHADSALSLAYSLIEVFMLLSMLVIALIIAACRSLAGDHFDRLIVVLISLLGLAVGFQELVGVSVAWSTGHQFSYDIALTHFAHPRFYNQLQSWTVPLIVALPILFPRQRMAAFFCIAILGLHWFILLMTGSRGSTLAILTALSVTLIFSAGLRTTLARWQLAGILLGVALYSLMFLGPDKGWEPPASPTIMSRPGDENRPMEPATPEPSSDGQNSTDAANPYFNLSLGRPMMHTSGRLALWRIAAEFAREQPWLGIGPMNYACRGPLGRIAHPHNTALQILSEWGMPATLILFALIIGALRHLVPVLKHPPERQFEQQRKLQILLATAILAAGLHAGLSGLFIMPASQMAGTLILGWLLGTIPIKESPPSSYGKQRVALGILLVTLLAGIACSSLAWREIVKMPEYRSRLPLIERALPRFWQLGKACRLHTELTVDQL
jgi:putative inorganic carbon (HCO3(-)) transporter